MKGAAAPMLKSVSIASFVLLLVWFTAHLGVEDFPSVSNEQPVGVLGIAEKMMNSENIEMLYETAA